MSFYNWFQRRFYEFRAGNNIYIGFSAALFSMMLIIQRFLIEKIPFFTDIIENFTSFLLIFLMIYIPASTIIGNWHYKNYENLQQTYYFLQNPGVIRAFRLILEIKTGKYDKEDVKKFVNLLNKLEKESMTDELR